MGFSITRMPIYAGKVYRMFLRSMYRFDRWHLYTLRERIYAQDIIRFCNNRPVRNSFVEIGCGLGDIIRNVNYGSKLGLDHDKAVVGAAAVMNRLALRPGMSFGTFSFPGSVLDGRYDVIVMVNWIHAFSPEALAEGMNGYFRNNLNPGGVLIIDTVQDPEYRYNHDIGFLTRNLDCRVEKIGDYERQRSVWAIHKKE
jgi:hypothetical protein